MGQQKLSPMKGTFDITWFQLHYDKTLAFSEEDPMNGSSKDI